MRKLKKSELKRVYGGAHKGHIHADFHSGPHNHGVGGGAGATATSAHTDDTHSVSAG